MTETDKASQDKLEEVAGKAQMNGNEILCLQLRAESDAKRSLAK